jgi:hypothetical protein
MAQVRRADVPSVGIEGLRDDDLAFARAGGFWFDQIAVPVSISQGGENLMVPLAHGRRLGAHVPGARCTSCRRSSLVDVRLHRCSIRRAGACAWVSAADWIRHCCTLDRALLQARPRCKLDRALLQA